MSAYITELLLDLLYSRLDVVSRCDIQQSVQKLLDTDQINEMHILALDTYLSGCSITEIKNGVTLYPGVKDKHGNNLEKYVYIPNVDELLIQILALIEEISQYTDELFLQYGLGLYPKYKKIAPALRNKLQQYGRELNNDLVR